MSRRGMDAPLAVQMDHLKKSMQKRDKRRDQDRQQRLVSAVHGDPYADTSRPRQSTGGVSLGPGAAAQAAVLNAAALEGPARIRCELCQADFRNEATLRQHEEGPAHKKALAKEKARLEREAWMENPSAAANALGAAAWLNGAEGAISRHTASQHQSRNRKQPGIGRGAPPGNAAPDPLPKPRNLSHAELLAQARKANEPISIDGWVPPSLGSDLASPQTEDLRKVGSSSDEPVTAHDESASAELLSASRDIGDGEGDAQKGPDTDAEQSLLEGLAKYGESSSEDEESGSEPEQTPSKFESFF